MSVHQEHRKRQRVFVENSIQPSGCATPTTPILVMINQDNIREKSGFLPSWYPDCSEYMQHKWKYLDPSVQLSRMKTLKEMIMEYPEPKALFLETRSGVVYVEFLKYFCFALADTLALKWAMIPCAKKNSTVSVSQYVEKHSAIHSVPVASPHADFKQYLGLCGYNKTKVNNVHDTVDSMVKHHSGSLWMLFNSTVHWGKPYKLFLMYFARVISQTLFISRLNHSRNASVEFPLEFESKMS